MVSATGHTSAGCTLHNTTSVQQVGVRHLDIRGLVLLRHGRPWPPAMAPHGVRSLATVPSRRRKLLQIGRTGNTILSRWGPAHGNSSNNCWRNFSATATPANLPAWLSSLRDSGAHLYHSHDTERMQYTCRQSACETTGSTAGHRLCHMEIKLQKVTPAIGSKESPAPPAAAEWFPSLLRL
jgi:hypothetical protein